MPGQAQRGDRNIAPPIGSLGAKRPWSALHSGGLTIGRSPVPIVQEAGWTPWSVDGTEILAATTIRSLDHPARSDSLYRRSCRGRLRGL